MLMNPSMLTFRMSVLLPVICVGICTSHTVTSAVAQEKNATQVEIVVGGRLPEESGDWDANDSPLLRPFGIAFDSQNNMYIVELEGGRVHKRTPEGTLTHVSGDGSKSYMGDGGNFASATFNGMHNCAITKDDQLYIADSWNHCIRKVDLKTGIITTVAGTGEKGFAGDGGSARHALFDHVMCITLTPDDRTLHIADLGNRRIRAFNPGSGSIDTVAGTGQKGIPENGVSAKASPLMDPRAVAADHLGNIYILERGGHSLRVVRPDGTIATVAGTGKSGFNDGPGSLAQFASPKHICVDDLGNVYVADDANKAIRRYSATTGEVSTVLGRGFGDPTIQLLQPHGVCWHAGTLYVLDTSHNRILKLQP